MRINYMLCFPMFTQRKREKLIATYQHQLILNPCCFHLGPPSNTQLQTNNVNPVVLGNGQITLLCAADAYPSPQYSFYKGDKRLITSSIGEFEITKAKFSDEGSYKCIVNNNLGQDESDVIVLKVYGKFYML